MKEREGLKMLMTSGRRESVWKRRKRAKRVSKEGESEMKNVLLEIRSSSFALLCEA